MVVLWDQARWDEAEWAGQPPAPGGWGDDWQWWYQPQTTGPPYYSVLPLNEKLVEARWTTDAHTMADGTFRGDIQPGTLTAQFWDPTHSLDNLDKYGAVWAWYKPTNQVWAWFYDSFTRGVVAPGDPAGADCVFSGTTWPARLTANRNETTYPAQSVAARLAALVASMGQTGIRLPKVSANVAAQSQTVAATAAVQTSTQGDVVYPGYLALVRDAAANGVAWLSYTTAGDTGPGAMVVNYARWEAATIRNLDRSQVVAGPPSTASIEFLINWVQWAGTGPTGTASKMDQVSAGNLGSNGSDQIGPMRLYGNVTPTSGAEYSAAFATGIAINSAHSDPTEQTLSTIDLQSGNRWTATGQASAAQWDPYAHTFAPTDVARLDIGGGNIKQFRVQKSDHRLTSQVWETTHYLEKYVVPTALP